MRITNRDLDIIRLTRDLESYSRPERDIVEDKVGKRIKYDCGDSVINKFHEKSYCV